MRAARDAATASRARRRRRNRLLIDVGCRHYAAWRRNVKRGRV